MAKPKLPLGIQSFHEIRTGGFGYADKTPFIDRLVGEGKYFFLSRPRRFGKSLLVDTLDCAFSGKKELFNGLHLESTWDWDVQYPVLRVDWAEGTPRSPDDLRKKISMLVRSWEETWRVGPGTGEVNFTRTVRRIAEKEGSRVVILVDEYDKPILDNLERPTVAGEMRDILKEFYGTIKPLDSSLKFVFFTGVSKFAKAGIFSGLNNLFDISLTTRYSALCGYTEDDVERVFGEYLRDFDREMVREWYNGYSWCGERVYNPFDILLLFAEQRYHSHWFETGTPAFLIKLWRKRPRPLTDFEGMTVGEELIGSFDVDNIRPEALLFQSGYLTIQSYISNPEEGTWYTLGFPNREVRQAFSRQVLALLTGDSISGDPVKLREVMESGDAGKLRELFFSLFSSIPHDWYRKNRLSGFEGYYASVVYAYFASFGFEIIPEDTTNKGRIDLTVKTKNNIWLFELKVKGLNHTGDKNPLQQLKEKGYAEKYRADGRQVRQVGIVFHPGTRNIELWETDEN